MKQGNVSRKRGMMIVDFPVVLVPKAYASTSSASTPA